MHADVPHNTTAAEAASTTSFLSWVLVGAVSLAVLCAALTQVPTTVGYVLMGFGAVGVGISYGVVFDKLPSTTHRAVVGVVLLFITLAIVGVAIVLTSAASSTPPVNQSIYLEPQ